MNWENNVLRVTPYTAGEQPKDPEIIKLNTNENPYPPAPGVSRVLDEMEHDPSKMRLYPDMDSTLLVEALARREGVSPAQIFVGVGSDDVISMAFMTFFRGTEKILFPDITYSFYSVWAEVHRIPYETVPLTEDYRIRPEDYLPAVTGRPNGGVIFPNPNAPTGIALPLAEVERIVAGNPDSVVIVDEAYIDFGGESALPLLPKYENLLVVRTFSKSRSLAGMRIGYAVGNEKLISYLQDVKFSFNSYTMNLAAQKVGLASVEDEVYFRACTDRICETRDRFVPALQELGFEVLPSSANFVFARHPQISGDDLLAQLRARKVLVRHFTAPRIRDFLRITIGTDAQMQSVLLTLEDILRDAADH